MFHGKLLESQHFSCINTNFEFKLINVMNMRCRSDMQQQNISLTWIFMHCKYFTRLFKWTLLAEWEIAILCKCWEDKRLPNGWKAQCRWAHSFVDIWWNFISASSSYFMKHVAIRSISRDHWHLMQIWVFQPPTQASIAYFFQSEKIFLECHTRKARQNSTAESSNEC